MFRHLAFTLLVLLSLVNLSLAKKGEAFTDSEKAGIEYQIQGEYEGAVAGEQWGAQVIATGDNMFRATGYPGGLPGQGWNGDKGETISGELDGETLELEGDYFTVKVDGKAAHIFDESGDKVGSLDKIVRKSPSLGEKAPEGAIVLFDGSKKSLENWNKGKLIEGKLLGATSCFTKEELGDHVLHVEFRTPFMPKANGQDRGNSGVYVQSRYEVQVLDSFGLDGKDNECGGIYQVSKPKVNMCLPPLVWQTYDIEFKAAKWADGKKTENARITVKHNGVTIHEDLELPRHTPGRSKEADGPAPLFLQDHSNPVAFRNIWVIKK